MNVSEFIDLIEQHDYMADSQIASMRRQLSMGKLDMSVEELVKFLLSRRRLTKYQAKKLLAEAMAGDQVPSAPLSEGRRRAQNNWLQVDAPATAPDDLSTEDVEEPSAPDPFGLGPLDDLRSSSDLYFDESSSFDPLADSGHRKVKARANPWDSPLILMGSGGLLLLLLVGGLLYFWLSFDSGDELFQQAEANYRGGSYVQAVAEYSRFLRRFPKHTSAPLAEVRLAMASMWRTVEGANDWEQALKTSQQVLPEVETLPAFGEVRPELATLLPEIAAALAEQAYRSTTLEEKQNLVAQAEEAMQLVNNPAYIPTSLRQAQQSRITTIEAMLDGARRDIDRTEARDAALESIAASAAEGNFQQVYQIRGELLESYPTLRNDATVTAAVAGAARVLVKQVRPVEPLPVPQTDDPRATTQQGQIIFAQRTPRLPADVQGEVGVFRLHGTAYAIDLASGSLLWRRYVGLGDGSEAVLYETDDGQKVAVLVDHARNELVALDQRSGQLIWRHEFASRLFRPRAQGNTLLVVETDGKAWKLDQVSGQVLTGVQLPQQVSAPLGGLSGIPAVFAVAEHSNVFVLSSDDLSCLEVIPVGHEVGMIQVEPTGTLRHLFLFENVGFEHCLLHPIEVDAHGQNARFAQNSVRMGGQVVVAPEVVDSRVIATNDQGEVLVYEVNLAAQQTPVRLAASTKASRQEPRVSYPVFDRGMLWVCDQRLTRYVMQLSRGSVVRKMVAHDGDTFVAPPILWKDYIIHARHQPGAEGFVIQSQRLGAEQLEPVWQITLAAPLAGEIFPLEGLKRPLLVTTRGNVFEMPRSEGEATAIVDQSTDHVYDVTRQFRFGPGQAVDEATRVFFPSADEERALVVRAENTQPMAHLVSWDVPAALRACTPAVWDGRIVIPTTMGQVVALDPKSGTSDIHPFQPDLAFGELVEWRPPVAVGPAAPSVVISDGNFRLFRVGMEAEPELHLAELEKVTLESPLTGQMAVSGLMLVAVGQREGGTAIRLFQLPELAEQDEIALEGELIMEPREMAGFVYLATSVEGMVALGDDFTMSWMRPLDGRHPIAGPMAVGERLAVGFADGEVWILNAQTGEPELQYDIGEPLSQYLSWSEGTLWAHGYDGTLHRIRLEPDAP